MSPPCPPQLSQQLDSLLGMLCADVAPADGASIQQNLKLLEEKLQSVGGCLPLELKPRPLLAPPPLTSTAESLPVCLD